MVNMHGFGTKPCLKKIMRGYEISAERWLLRSLDVKFMHTFQKNNISPYLRNRLTMHHHRNISSGKFTIGILSLRNRYSTITIDHTRYSMLERFVTVSLYYTLSTAASFIKTVSGSLCVTHRAQRSQCKDQSWELIISQRRKVVI
jgi:hypothetical protein